MIDLANKKQLIQYLQQHELYTKKKLGQNFLVDRNALDKIVGAAELSKDDCVIEVGPGLGTLTKELVFRVNKVIAIEKDEQLAKLLHCCIAPLLTPPDLPPDQVRGRLLKKGGKNNETMKQLNNLDIVSADILKVNLPEILANCSEYKVVANIPYYITSRIIRFFLEQKKKPETIVLLTQKEVAERICAKPGDMSILSVSVQYYGQPEIVDIVPRTSFFPAPEVDSAILKISETPNNPTQPPLQKGRRKATESTPLLLKEGQGVVANGDFFRLVHHGFASRRKTLLNNLSAGYHLDKNQVLDILEGIGLNDKTRAQELSVEKWEELCGSIAKLLNC